MFSGEFHFGPYQSSITTKLIVWLFIAYYYLVLGVSAFGFKSRGNSKFILWLKCYDGEA
jgi:hypothetical protein